MEIEMKMQMKMEKDKYIRRHDTESETRKRCRERGREGEKGLEVRRSDRLVRVPDDLRVQLLAFPLRSLTRDGGGATAADAGLGGQTKTDAVNMHSIRASCA